MFHRLIGPVLTVTAAQKALLAAGGGVAADAGFDWKKAAPWLAGGAGVLFLAAVMMSRRPAR